MYYSHFFLLVLFPLCLPCKSCFKIPTSLIDNPTCIINFENSNTFQLELESQELRSVDILEQLNLSDCCGINLENNDIITIEPLAKLKPNASKKLQYIFLAHNQIVNISLETLIGLCHAFPELAVLNLENNPIQNPELIDIFNEEHDIQITY
ncbi:MAG: hypothetical protein WDZ41_05645 [Candidatus Babeliales bacterium]